MPHDAEGRPIHYRNTAECDHRDCIYKWCFRNPDNWEPVAVEAFTGHRMWLTEAPEDAVVTFGCAPNSRLIDRRK